MEINSLLASQTTIIIFINKLATMHFTTVTPFHSSVFLFCAIESVLNFSVAKKVGQENEI